MSRNLLKSRHKNVRCLIDSSYIRECFEYFDDLQNEEILEVLEQLNDEDMDNLLTVLIRMRQEREHQLYLERTGKLL